MKKIFNLAVALSVLASSVALSSCDKDDPEDEPINTENTTPGNGDQKEHEKPADPVVTGAKEITVKAGDVVAATAKGTTMEFTVKSVAGTAAGKNQEVILDASGKEYKLEDAGASYLALVNGEITPVKSAEAKAAPATVLLALRGTSSKVDYTLCSPSEVLEGAMEVTFVKKN